MKRIASLLLALLVALVGVVGLVSANSADVDKAITGSVARSVTTILYDGALGTLPGDQGFDYLAFPAGATQTISSGGTILDTTVSEGISAGYFGRSALMPVLDRTTGFTVTFEAQLLVETHSTQHRAGFSIIVLGDDGDGSEAVLGIEMAFWPDEIWAQDDDTLGGTLFTHAEGVAFDTSAAVTYTLTIISETYRLSAGNQEILSGRVRDYSNFGGFPDPYETPNFLFLGDDTTSASGRVKLDYVVISVPGSMAAVFIPLVLDQ